MDSWGRRRSWLSLEGRMSKCDEKVKIHANEQIQHDCEQMSKPGVPSPFHLPHERGFLFYPVHPRVDPCSSVRGRGFEQAKGKSQELWSWGDDSLALLLICHMLSWFLVSLGVSPRIAWLEHSCFSTKV